MHIQAILGYIDADKTLERTHRFPRSCLALIRAYAQATARIQAKQKAAIQLGDGLNQDTIDLPPSGSQAPSDLRTQHKLHYETNIQ
ncbi:MAG TPA: hypothetical protein VMP00_13760, partial [Burkholderiales bacterium]|nr:hypothetical protein [Burkholderiales bacterium]